MPNSSLLFGSTTDQLKRQAAVAGVNTARVGIAVLGALSAGARSNEIERPVLEPHSSNPNFPKFRFQFPPSGDFTEDGVGSDYAEATSLNRPFPIRQFVKGKQRVYSFEAMLFADSVGSNIDKDVDALRRAATRDDDLGRPPIWEFFWGPINEVVVVDSVGGIKYGRLRPDGTFRDARFNLQLSVYNQFDIKLTDPDARPHDTVYYIAQDGDTWERIAARQYNSALLGDFLRRRYPSMPGAPTPGTILRLPDKAKMADLIVTPESIPLKRTAEGLALAREMFRLRGGVRTSLVVR